MPTIMWSNGKVDKAPTWQELLDLVREEQWKAYSETGFREELATRAWRWSLTSVDPAAAPRRLFLQLQAARLIQILPDTDKPKGD